MRRRAFLGSLGTVSTMGLAGCAGILDQSCDPGEDELGEISIDSDDYEVPISRYSEESVSIQGTVVYMPVRGLVVDDGTGLADVVARRSDEGIDQSGIDVGDCVSATGPVNTHQCEENEQPYIGATELDVHGSGDEEIEPREDYPVSDVAPNWHYESEESEFSLVGGDPVQADRLVVRWRRSESVSWLDAERARWHELTDVGPEETIPEGSSFRFDGRDWDVSILWESEDGRWTREVQSLGT